MALDAFTNFTQDQVNEMQSLISINEEIKKLEEKKKILSESVKKHIIAAKTDKVTLGLNSFTVTEACRRTVKKATKDQFIAELVGMNKKHLVSYSIEPDLDSIFAEISAGALTKDFVDKYVTVTPVTTLRCN